MSYARARLWLGITGVGSLVVIAALALVFRLPGRLFSTSGEYGFGESLQLAALIGMFVLWLLPFDFLGGFLLPKRYKKSKQTFGSWFSQYFVAAVAQTVLFMTFGSLIILLAQAYGLAGGVLAISFGIVCCVVVRNRLILGRRIHPESASDQVKEATSLAQSWEKSIPRTIVVQHEDIGFTGGVVGLGPHAQIVIPQAWLSFDREQLAAAIARRAAAVNSGSYSRVLVLAFAWNICGFLVCSQIPGAGLATVAGLVTTISGFTLWSFLGLLTLPTLSRNASLKIDEQLLRQGIPANLISETAFTMDQLQDGEPERSRLVDAIFHPVPNVSSRNLDAPSGGLAAWNVARTTLFFSWPCLGFLARSVHCNIGRPELWMMLPTD